MALQVPSLQNGVSDLKIPRASTNQLCPHHWCSVARGPKAVTLKVRGCVNGEGCDTVPHFLEEVAKNTPTPGNNLEERLLDQAQAWASYTPPFWGHSRSIPQGMILDVQPLVKSLFCPIRPFPNGFFDSEASIP